MAKQKLPNVREAMWGVAASCVAFAYFSAPALRYADPISLVGVAIAIGVAVVSCSGFFLAGEVKPLEGVLLVFHRMFLAMLVGSAVTATMLAGLAGREARDASIANDRRCLAMQRDMLSSHPRRSDDAALFQAFACRPQGEGSVHAPAPAPARAAR